MKENVPVTEKKTTNVKNSSKNIPLLKLVRSTIEYKQGTSSIYLTKNDVNALRMLWEGEFDGVYTSKVKPRTKYRLQANGTIVGQVIDDGRDDNVVITKKFYSWITDFRDKNRARLAFDRDFRRQY